MWTKIWDGREESQYTVNITQSPWSALPGFVGRGHPYGSCCHMAYPRYYQIFATYMHFQKYQMEELVDTVFQTGREVGKSADGRFC